ncbi:MAG: arsenosugar biosynthesis radical SAM protein ArsS [Chlamydiae bacterium]|nr:arsenosugar biosynthesis radical SAM protein ArsS [Chlamydiota bacterium]MBI3267135.1 arsenosugar biosynthesis radical SAM protein ArsS [Chlamydiota bacterium]
MNHFDQKLTALGVKLKKGKLHILQVNVGKLCNLACVHCHVEAGPSKKKENMTSATAEAVVRLMDQACFETLDITGGAPELNPHFKYLIKEGRRKNLHVIDRCNLTVFFEHGMEDIPDFLAQHQVEVIASLPCYSKENVDEQRGRGTFAKSIEALQWLNRLGYGRPESGLALNLVYNPVGPHLPPSQAELEADYKKRLRDDFGIAFNQLYTITNMPITRYAKYLKALSHYESYIELLINSFNPGTLGELMCRDTLSVGWDGRIYDCDFNQMLGIQIRNGKPVTIFDVCLKDLKEAPILMANHCFACTAGCGSSCQGALTSNQLAYGS